MSAAIVRCTHCGDLIERCTACAPPFKGWKHSAYPSQPVGAHYCGGRSINPIAEPAEHGGRG